MHCNQPYYGNVFNNGQYCGFVPPNIIPQNTYPEVIGEGEVTSVALPDGTFQFFFVPTIKWAPQSVPYPYYTNMVYTNNIISGNGPNNGAWFVRTINSPRPYPRTEITNFKCNDYNMSYNCDVNCNTDYQLKFHNDQCSSTTDMYYFKPCINERDCCIAFPSKACAAVQMDAPIPKITPCQNACCDKCNCKRNDNLPPKSSTMSFGDNSNFSCPICEEEQQAEDTCKCCSPPKKKTKKTLAEAPIKRKAQEIQCNLSTVIKKEMKLLPSDQRHKRIKLFEDSKTKNAFSECNPPPCEDKSAITECPCSCNDDT